MIELSWSEAEATQNLEPGFWRGQLTMARAIVLTTPRAIVPVDALLPGFWGDYQDLGLFTKGRYRVAVLILAWLHNPEVTHGNTPVACSVSLAPAGAEPGVLRRRLNCVFSGRTPCLTSKIRSLKSCFMRETTTVLHFKSKFLVL